MAVSWTSGLVRPWTLLGAGQVWAAAACAAAWVLQGMGTSGSQELAWLWLPWTLLTLLTLIAVPRLGERGLLTSLCLSAVLISVGAVVVVTGVLQLVNGLGLVMLGVLAGYSLTGRALAVFLAVAAGTYLAALVANPLVDSPWIAVVVLAMLVVNTVHVGYLADRLRAAASTDPLTGALNRAGLEDAAPAVRSAASRAGARTTVVLIDLDDFKGYNDRHGHIAGDRVLSELAGGWRTRLRPSDLLARIGGDEFVVVLPGSDVEHASAALVRMRAASRYPWTAGIADWPDRADLYDAVAQADQAMYRGKQNR